MHFQYTAMMDIALFDFLAGIFAMFLAFKAYVALQCRRYLRSLLGRFIRVSMGTPRSSAAQQLVMEPKTIDSSWIKSGAPTFLAGEYAQSPDHRASSGVWSCEGPATFEWQFGSDETVLILDGRVEIDYLGEKFVLEPGGSALFFAGTRAVWHVPKYVRKTYMIHYPNYIVRMARQILGAFRFP